VGQCPAHVGGRAVQNVSYGGQQLDLVGQPLGRRHGAHDADRAACCSGQDVVVRQRELPAEQDGRAAVDRDQHGVPRVVGPEDRAGLAAVPAGRAVPLDGGPQRGGVGQPQLHAAGPADTPAGTSDLQEPVGRHPAQDQQVTGPDRRRQRRDRIVVRDHPKREVRDVEV
jgi:hypothetical protein